MNTAFYHIYLSGNNYQDIFYRDSDFIQVINRLALAAYEKQTQVLAYIFHQNHFHLVIRTADVSSFMHYFRMSLTHWFHRQYRIGGTIGMRKYGKHLVKNEEDLLDLLKYVLRNEVRHRLAIDPLKAKWSSIQCYFKDPKATGCQLLDIAKIQQFLPWKKGLPIKYRMLDTGLIDPNTFIDFQFVESLFGSQAAFLCSMYVESGRELAIKTKLDEAKSVVARVPLERVKDNDLLEYAHACIAANFSEKNILRLSSEEKYQIAHLIRLKFKNVSLRQLSRILAIPRSTLWENLGYLNSPKCPES